MRERLSRGDGSVTLDRRTGRYRVRVMLDGRRRTFPDTFVDRETAARSLRYFWELYRLAQRGTNASHLYVVEIIGHAVKVGITTKLASRLSYHKSMARSFGHELGRVWVTPVHEQAKANERALTGGRRGEYLKRSFDDVIGQALALPMTRAREVSHG